VSHCESNIQEFDVIFKKLRIGLKGLGKLDDNRDEDIVREKFVYSFSFYTVLRRM
jgi:hypothetical protein